MYICDYGNSAIRRISTVVNTKAPTLAPSVSIRPTPAPSTSMRPTPSPSVSPTPRPSAVPTTEPTVHAPTQEPTSSSPTVSPTASPTAEPTQAPTISNMPTMALEPTSVPTMLNGDCLEITLFDEFGDGWGGLELTVNHTGKWKGPPGIDYTYVNCSYANGTIVNGSYANDTLVKCTPVAQWKDAAGASKSKPKPHSKFDPNSYFSSKTLSPSLGQNPLVHRICASLDEYKHYQRGRYVLEIKHPKGEAIPNSWEIQWQVATKEGDYNNHIYGGLVSRVEFEFGDTGVFQLISADRRAIGADTCRRCEHPPPKPKPAANSHRLLADVDDDTSAVESIYPVPFVLHDSKGDGWFSSSGLGAKFSISDSSKTTQLSSGTICGDFLKEDCQTRLADGDYYFRVGGGGDENRDQISWTFCGIHGKAMQQLSFAIMKGKCVPGHLSDAKDMIGTIEETKVTMRGEFVLSNVFAEDLNVMDTTAFETAIASLIHVKPVDVMVTEVCVTRGNKLCSTGDDDENGDSRRRALVGHEDSIPGRSLLSYVSRSLSETYSLDVVFVAMMVTEDYDIQGSLYHDTVELFDKKKKYLDESFRKHEIQGEIRYSAATLGSSALAFAKVERMVPLRATDFNYNFKSTTAAPTPGPLSGEAAVVHTKVVDETVAQEELVLTPVVLVGATVLVLAGLVLWTRRKGQEVVGEAEASKDEAVVGTWRNKVLGDDTEETCSPKARSSVASESLEPSRNKELDDGDGSMAGERDLYRISPSEVRPSRYKQSEAGRGKDSMIRMVHISGSGPTGASGEVSCHCNLRHIDKAVNNFVFVVQKIVRNQLQFSHDDDSSV
jgi:hypothetical protein